MKAITASRAPVQLLKVEEACAILATCKTVDEAKSIRDKAEAIRVYLRSQKASAEAQNDAAEIKLRAEQRLGELLREQKERGERHAGHGKAGSQRATQLPPTLRELGISKTQASRWQQVAEVPKEKFEAHLAGLRRSGERITTAVLTREVERTEKHAAIADQALSMPALEGVQPCPVIYADPPWRYGNTAGASAAEDEYPTIPLADICALHIPATKDAVLFLWATSPLLPEALQVTAAWGFVYKGSMIWDKGMGTGNWVLNCHELLLIAVRGDMPCPAPPNRPKSVIVAQRGKHSEKPDAFAEAIDRMFPDLPKVELFARKPRKGWATWGNQA
jgi:N6-adenosine-specific RNA methylase IME4